MWFLYALLSALFAGLQSFLSKVVAEKKMDSYHVSTSSSLVALATTFVLLFITGSTFAGLPSLVFWLGVASGLMYIGRTLSQFEALKFIDSAIYFPLYKVVGPALVAVTGVLLFHDVLGASSVWGIVLSCLLPLLLITRAEHRRQKNLWLGLVLMLASTTLAAAVTLLNAYAAGAETGYAVPFMAIAYGFSALFGIAFFARRHGVQNMQAAIREHSSKQSLVIGAAIGVLQCLSFFFLLLAFPGNSVGVVYSIAAHYILIPVFLSIWLYKEHWNAQKALALVVSILALVLLHP